MFVTRYIDVFTMFWSPYNTLMKCCLVVNSVLFALYLAWQKFSQPGSKRIGSAVGSTAVIVFTCFCTATWFNYQFSLMEILWSFSRIISICAEIPQLIMVYRMPEWEFWLKAYYSTVIGHIVFYGGNWVYRYFNEGMLDPIAVTGGIGELAVVFGFLIAGYIRNEPETDYPVDKKIPIIVIEEFA